MDLWSEIEKLNGRQMRTLDRQKRFTMMAVSADAVIIQVAATEKFRPIFRSEFEIAWRALSTRGEVSRSEIEAEASLRSHPYVAALPGVCASVWPIVLQAK